MGENCAMMHGGLPPLDISIDQRQQPAKELSEAYDDDGRLKRTGTVWTASAHIITAVIGSGVLSLAWAVAQLGWVAGPVVMILFSLVTYYTSTLLSDCYRSGDPLTGRRNYTYMEAVQAYLGGMQFKFCGCIQYLNLVGAGIAYTVAAALSMMAIGTSNCLHSKGDQKPCHTKSSSYMIAFGAVEIFFSQIPDLDKIWWLSIVAAVMSFTYSGVGLGLVIAQVVANGAFKGSLTGVRIGEVTQTQKIWRTFQALGNIAFAYAYSLILIEIQDTIKSPPSEAKTMRKASMLSVAVTTAFYVLCGFMGYAAFGDDAPGNLLTAFGSYGPFWLVDIANAAIVIHLVGAYQVYLQPLFAVVEKWAARRWPGSDFVTKEYTVRLLPGRSRYSLNSFRLLWRSAFVVSTTVVSMLLPFFASVVGFVGAVGFWPMTVYFPVEMYLKQKKISKWSSKWVCMQVLSVFCLIISIAAAAGSVAGIVQSWEINGPFKAE